VTIQTLLIESVAGLTELGPRYDALVRGAGDAGVFYEIGWLERAWPYYHRRLGGTMAFVIAEQGDALVGLAPLVLVTRSWTQARRRLLGFVGGTGDELANWMPAFLFASEDAHERPRIMSALADGISQLAWDQLDLRSVRDACPSVKVLGDRLSGLSAERERLTTPRVRLDGGWDRYWAGRSKRLLRMIDRGLSRAAADGLAVRHDVTPGVPLASRQSAAALHRARQDQVRSAGRARNSPFDSPQDEAVFWSLIDWATERGSARTHWLTIGDRVAAYIVTLHCGGTTFTYLNAMDPSADRYHPGSLVLAGLIEREATEYGAGVIDLMAGANLTKSLFATEELQSTRISVVNQERLVSRARAAWVQAARRVAARLGR